MALILCIEAGTDVGSVALAKNGELLSLLENLEGRQHAQNLAVYVQEVLQEHDLDAGDLDAVCAAAGNALEECSGAKDTEAIKALLREHGAVTALMTGSGSAVFGIFRDETSARAAAAAAKHRWKQVYTAQPDKGGARVV